jgi:hypothetical protein
VSIDEADAVIHNVVHELLIAEMNVGPPAVTVVLGRIHVLMMPSNISAE